MYHTKQAVDWHLSEVETVNLTRDEWSEICLDIEKRSAMCEADSNSVSGEVRDGREMCRKMFLQTTALEDNAYNWHIWKRAWTACRSSISS